MTEKKSKQIPLGWSEAKLSEVSEIIFGQSPPSESYNKNGVGLPFFQGKTEFGTIYPTACKWCTKPTKIAQKNDILISVRAPVGPTNLAPNECAIGRGLAAIRTLTIPRAYIQHYLKYIEQDLISKATGTTFQAITKDVLINQKILIAPLNEQKRIVDKIEKLFSDLDDAEANLKKVQNLIKTYRQSVLKAAVTGELTKAWRKENKVKHGSGSDLLKRILKNRYDQWKGKGKYKEPQEPDISNLPKLPQGWVYATPDQLKDNSPHSLSIGPFGSDLKVEDYKKEGVPLVFVRHIRAKCFDKLNPQFISLQKANQLASHKVISGDLLITKMGDPPGDVCIYPPNLKDAIITADCIRFRPSQLFLDKNYLEIAINSQIVQAQILEVTKGVAQQKITLANFRSIAIPIPSLDEQIILSQKCQEFFHEIDDMQNYCETELHRSNILRQSILKSAFSGQLLPQDTNDEPASELLKRIQAEKLFIEQMPSHFSNKKMRPAKTNNTRKPLSVIKKVKQ